MVKIQKKYDKVVINIYETRKEMGEAAAREASQYIKKLLEEKEEINCMFAAAPSQNEFLSALVADQSIPWQRVNAFHMDEYMGLTEDDSHSFRSFLNQAIFKKVSFKKINLIKGENEPKMECERYAEILEKYPLDIVFMGIGENGHIAFNDPPVADFMDSQNIKMVELEENCRKQQVHDKCFNSLEEVPKYAFTVTIPKMMQANRIFCIVPGLLKAQAVHDALTGPISEACPASILRAHDNAELFLDKDSASKL
jgi:glucosamine-6-phosphate deaminase